MHFDYLNYYICNKYYSCYMSNETCYTRVNACISEANHTYLQDKQKQVKKGGKAKPSLAFLINKAITTLREKKIDF